MYNSPLKHIHIEGLFGMFTHDIPLNEENNLTILYGVNGVGKTTVFRILYNAFGDGNTYFNIQKNKNEPFTEASFHIQQSDKEEVLKVFGDKQTRLHTTTFPVFFIPTQRLTTIFGYDSAITISRQIKFFQNQTGNRIRSFSDAIAQGRYTLQEKIDKKTIKADLSDTELSSLWKKNQDKIEDLKDAGVDPFERLRVISLKKPEIEGENEIERAIQRAFASAELQNIENALTVVFDKDNFHERLRLFLDILNNRRYSFKRVKADNAKGFIFENNLGEEISPDDLSYGEQHAFVVLYALLFEVEEGSLVLIDEPEISLHVSWQMQFVDDMLEIIRLRKIAIMVATHSPSIVNGRWDLTVNLKAYENEPETP